MNYGKPKRTECNRCGATVRYRHGIEPEFCDACHDMIRRRSL